MRAVAVLVLALVVIASARTTFKRGNNAQTALVQLLKKQLGHSPLTSKLSHFAKSSKKTIGSYKRTEGESDEYCDADIPCMEINDNDEFYGCVIEEAVQMEERFHAIYMEAEGKGLLPKFVNDFIWEVRFSDDLSIDEKGELEMIVDGICIDKFEAIWGDLDGDTQDEVMGMACVYDGLREGAYERGDDK